MQGSGLQNHKSSADHWPLFHEKRKMNYGMILTLTSGSDLHVDYLCIPELTVAQYLVLTIFFLP